MSKDRPHGTRVSRESRLLLLTVTVCAGVLLVLARFRFPESPPVATIAVPPLERLAARASYDALAADIERVEPMIAPNIVVLRVAPPPPSEPRGIRDLLSRPSEPSGVRHVAALRVGADVALASIDPDARIEGIVGDGGGRTPAAVLAADTFRQIARVHVPEAPVREIPQLALASLPTPAYVVVVEGTQAGVTLRPVFLGRSERFASVRWTRPLLPLGGIAVAPGALLFSLAGEFIGTVVLENGAPAVAGARDVLDTVNQLATSPPAPLDLGITVQPLTPALAAALGVEHGLIVSEVDPDGPAADLEPSDVITAVDDWSTDDPDQFLMRLAARRAGASITLAIVRNGERRTVTSRPAAAAPDGAGAGAPVLFALERGLGTRVESTINTSRSGLLTGDLIVRAGTTSAPTPMQVRRLLAAPTSSGYATLIVLRDSRQQVVAVPVARRDDAAAR